MDVDAAGATLLAEPIVDGWLFLLSVLSAAMSKPPEPHRPLGKAPISPPTRPCAAYTTRQKTSPHLPTSTPPSLARPNSAAGTTCSTTPNSARKT